MGAGGSRYGAGRPGWRRKCEHLLALDIRALSRGGNLPSERDITRYFSWQWTRGGEPAGNIYIHAEHDQVRLNYSVNGQPLQYPVWTEHTPCRYGGTRPWFRCPRCQCRRAVLYGTASDGRFGCRHCMRLAYASEAEDPLGRLWRKQRKLEAKLGEHYQRPKGMHQRTYDSILERITGVEEDKDAAFCVQAMALFGRCL